VYICIYITVFSKLYAILIKGFTFFTVLPKARRGTVNYGIAGVLVSQIKEGKSRNQSKENQVYARSWRLNLFQFLLYIPPALALITSKLWAKNAIICVIYFSRISSYFILC